MAKKKSTEKTPGEKKKVTKKVDPAPILFNEKPAQDDPKSIKPVAETSAKPENQSMEISEPLPLYKPQPKVTGVESGNLASQNPTSQKVLGNFDKTLPVYFQIHKGNIYSIFASAIIAPVRYIRNRAFPDIQSIEEHVLTIANGYIGSLDNNQLFLEIILREPDYEFVDVQGQVAMLRKPLPISRIKAIHVANDEIKRDITTKALTGDGGIIPESLFKVGYFKSLEKVETKEIPNPVRQDYTEELQRFDKILGAFAFVKNYSLLLVNKTESVSALPSHFFYMAQAVNKLPVFEIEKNDRSVQFYRKLFGIDKNVEQNELRWIFDRLNDSKNFTNSDVASFGDIIVANKQAEGSESIISEYLKNLTDNLKRKQYLGELPDLSDQIKLYINLFGSLRIYGNLNTEDKSISRRELPDLVSPSFGEYIFSCLGYYYGYTSLRNFEDKFIVKDKYLSETISTLGTLALKFQLATLFDYVIIESVFQTVFRSNASLSDFSFLNSIGLRKELLRKPAALPSNYSFIYAEVLGKINFSLKKKSAVEESVQALTKVIENIPILSELGLYCWREGINKNSLGALELSMSPDNIRYYIYFKKADILEALKTRKLDAVEFLATLELSIKLRELR
jgi:hypothetical protein